MKTMTGIGIGLAAALLAVAAPAAADVKAGVDAWSAGDYTAAVAEWRGPAASGDADAQFNLAQAYRLGRGVEASNAKAEEFYAKAAAQGHMKAADNYGLLLFQSGRREQALPYVQAAVERGDPRAQYLLGIAHFNGDMVGKDWVRAYALVSAANTTGLPQAIPAMKQMDEYIPLDQRQMGVALAAKMREDADATRARQLAAADLGSDSVAYSTPPPPVQVATAPLPSPVTRVHAPIVTTPVAPSRVTPSVAAAQAAVAEAARVTGTENPGSAGADFARPNAAPVQTAAAPAPTPAPRQMAPKPEPKPKPPVTAAAPAQGSDGPWRVQLGAFGVQSNATKLWSRLSARPELSGKSRFLVPAGRVTKLQAGGFATQAQANQACSALKRGGQECIVTR